MNKCIGIISWLPDNLEQRNLRLETLNKTLKSCDEVFNLPIVIIAQNWKDDDIYISKQSVIFHYEKLGIVKARKILRLKFLQSEYDSLIMLDDDCILEGDATEYLQTIDDNSDKIIQVFDNWQLKLFAISKENYAQVDMPDICVENLEGIEDELFIKRCQHLFKDKVITLPDCKIKLNVAQTFDNSTWKPEGYSHKDYLKVARNTCMVSDSYIFTGERHVSH